MEGEWAPAARRILEYLIIHLQCRKEEQLEEFTALRGTLVVSVDIEESVQPVNQSNCTTVIAAKGDFCHERLILEMRREMEGLLPLGQSKTWSGRGCPHESLHTMPFQVSFELCEKPGALREDCVAMKQYIHRLSLVHTTITFHYCVKAKGSISAKTYSAEKRDSTCLPDRMKLLHGGSHFVRKADWPCDKIHPTAGDPVDLFIPDKVAERGFSGQLRLTPVVSLCPCQKPFPNQPTRIATASIFVYDPAGLPILFPMKEVVCPFFEDPSRVASWERYSYEATLNSDPFGEEDTAKPDVSYKLHSSRKHNPDAREQTLLLFLFLGYSDPFQDQPGYSFWDQRAILAHLYPILLCSEQAVKGSIHTVVNRILKQHCREAQEQERLANSLPIMADAISSIVSSSTSGEFRARCFQRLQVADTQELQAAIKETLNKATLQRWRASSLCGIRKPLPKRDEERQSSTSPALSPVDRTRPRACLRSADLDRKREDSRRGGGPDCARRSQTRKRRPASRELSVEESRDPPASGGGEATRKQRGLFAEQDPAPSSSSWSHPPQIRPDHDGGSSVESRAGRAELLWQDEEDLWVREVSNLSQWTS